MKAKKNYTKQVLAAVILLLGIISYFLIFQSNGKKGNSRKIKLGFSGALSGPASFIGIEIKRGAEIAIDEINSSGGIQGKKLVLIFRDDEHEPRNTIAQYRELVEQEKVVGILGATNSASMLAVTPLVNNTLKVPVICPATDASEITKNEAYENGKDNYLFRVGMYGEGQANFMVNTAVEKLGYKNIGLLTWTGGWGTTGRGELSRRLKELGRSPVANETYDNDDADMTAQILKLQQAKAEIILNYGLVRENNFVVRTKGLLEDRTPYFSAWGIAGKAFSNAAGKYAEGVLVSTTCTVDGPQSPERVAFVNAYSRKYKEEMLAPVFALGAYDAVYLFKAAIEKAGDDPIKIREALENIQKFKGLIKQFDRPVFTRERHNSLTENDMILTRWTDGKLLEVKFDSLGVFVELANGLRKNLNEELNIKR